MMNLIFGLTICLFSLHFQLLTERALIKYNYMQVISMYLIPLVIFYFMFFQNKTYLLIIAKYENESRFNKISGRFIIGSILILLIVAMFMLPKFK